MALKTIDIESHTWHTWNGESKHRPSAAHKITISTILHPRLRTDSHGTQNDRESLFFLSLSIYCQRTASTRAEHTITTNHISTYHVHGRSSSSSSASTHASKDTRTPSTALFFSRLILGRQSFFDFSSLIFHYFVFLFFSPSIRVELHFTRIPRPFSFFRCIHRGLQGGKFKVLCISFLLWYRLEKKNTMMISCATGMSRVGKEGEGDGVGDWEGEVDSTLVSLLPKLLPCVFFSAIIRRRWRRKMYNYHFWLLCPWFFLVSSVDITITLWRSFLPL